MICLFTNKAWCFPFKRKTKAETAQSLEKIFIELEGDVENLITDEGVEFDLENLYEKYNINRYSVKACHVEIFSQSDPWIFTFS